MTTETAIREVEHVADVFWKQGRDVVVAVKDSGNGPRVDVREVIRPEAYPVETGDVQRRNSHRIAHGRKARPTRSNGYVGPTRCGFWLEPGPALELAEAIYRAASICEEANR